MIRNVVFDVGNVLVRWAPEEIVHRALGPSDDVSDIAAGFFKHELWRRLNLGEFTEAEAAAHYAEHLNMHPDDVHAIFFHVKDTQELVDGTADIVRRLHSAGHGVYALTDNVREIVAYLQERHDFWDCFDGAVVSAEVGWLKPAPEIYLQLVERYGLNPAETVFFDDVLRNVVGARDVGFHAEQFSDAVQCEAALRAMGLDF